MQIKFRVWDKVRNKWIEDCAGTHAFTDFFLDFDGNVTQFDGCFLGGPSEKASYFMQPLVNNYVVHRGTGVEDICGKEIFEGDLVELHRANQSTGFGLYEIFYKRGAFQLKEIEPNWLINSPADPYLHNYNICKVVGNIYENDDKKALCFS